MRRFRLLASLALCVATASSALADTLSGSCDLPKVKWMGELQAALQTRAVEAINLAASGGDERRLQQLIEPSAVFSAGGGDVGIPLGAGVGGIRALAKHMNADTYRFFNWSTIPAPISDPCGSHEVNVEFIHTVNGESFPVKFAFKSGRIVSATGWSQWFSTGPVKPVRN